MKRITKDEFIKRSNEIYLNKYNYSLVIYKNMKTTVKIICPVHDMFYQTPDMHLNGKYGCKKCSIENNSKILKKTIEQFIKKAKEIHDNKYDYCKNNNIKLLRIKYNENINDIVNKIYN